MNPAIAPDYEKLQYHLVIGSFVIPAHVAMQSLVAFVDQIIEINAIFA